MNTYFITGASGAVGSTIVPMLLQNRDTRIRILLRAESDEHLAQRLEALHDFWQLPPGDETHQRVEALRGDATLPKLGLDETTYARLCDDTTHLVHSAASVRMNDPLDHARHSAVGSAQAMLELARTLARRNTLQKMEFVSTVGIAGKRPGILPETWIDEARAFHNTYERSKAEAETLVRAAIEKEGLPITVHRPSMVIGDSRDGRIIHFQIFYYICEILSGRKTSGLLPDFGDARLDIIPVDHVAAAIVASSRGQSPRGHILNLCSGPERSPRIAALVMLVRQILQERGQELPRGRSIPRAWFAALPRLLRPFLPAPQKRLLATFPMYMDYLSDHQAFGNDVYMSWLKARNAPLPERADEYARRALDYYLGRIAASSSRKP
ncbi:SDR family oxidoreductase [Thauera butanivorans]|uniref:SDR family oxidoreductase n=1 Tax=Thauera butanivorans TaxID=86174 RepID=UPI000838BF3B|nr:SDR family oxidoreductase [Thauera butanivorans]